MLNVVIVEDNQHYRVKLYDIVNKYFGELKILFSVKTYKGYNDTLHDFINQEHSGHTIYILDICLDDNASGIDIANEIRAVDQDSIIIIITGRSTLIPETQKLRLNILDYVCKQINFVENINQLLKVSCDIFKLKKSVKFSIGRHDFNIKFDDVLYIRFNRAKRQTIIKTFDKEYAVSKGFGYFEDKINKSFMKVNRGCFVNFFNVKEVDYVNKDIIFQNDEKLENIIPGAMIKKVKEFMNNL